MAEIELKAVDTMQEAFSERLSSYMGATDALHALRRMLPADRVALAEWLGVKAETVTVQDLPPGSDVAGLRAEGFRAISIPHGMIKVHLVANP